MKKKVIAIALYIALLMTSLIPVTALAVGDTEGGAEPPVCTCTTKCSEGAVDSTCPVCSAEGADLSACKGREPRQDGDESGNPPDDQGGDQGGKTPDNQGGNPPEGQGGNPPEGQDGNPPDDQSGNPPDDQGGNPPEGQDGKTPDDQGSNPPEDQDGNPPEDQDGNPPDDPGDDEGKPGPVVHSNSLTITGATLAPKTYDGKTEGKVTAVSFTGVPEGQSLTLGTDYTATVVYDSADAGTGRTATVTVNLSNDNYTFADGGMVATYDLEEQEIAKADYTGETTATGYVVSYSILHSVTALRKATTTPSPCR